MQGKNFSLQDEKLLTRIAKFFGVVVGLILVTILLVARPARAATTQVTIDNASVSISRLDIAYTFHYSFDVKNPELINGHTAFVRIEMDGATFKTVNLSNSDTTVSGTATYNPPDNQTSDVTFRLFVDDKNTTTLTAPKSHLDVISTGAAGSATGANGTQLSVSQVDYNASKGTATYGYDISNFKPPYTLKVYNNGSLIKTVTIDAKAKPSGQVSFPLDSHLVSASPNLTFQLNKDGKEVTKVTVKFDDLRNCAGGNGQGYRFCDTLFSKSGITAPEYVSRFYKWAVGLAVVGASGMIIYAGFKYTTSRGNPTAINDAKDIIYNTLLGLALLILSFTILHFLGINVSNSGAVTVPPASTTTK